MPFGCQIDITFLLLSLLVITFNAFLMAIFHRVSELKYFLDTVSRALMLDGLEFCASCSRIILNFVFGLQSFFFFLAHLIFFFF